MAAGNLSLQPPASKGGEPETGRSQPRHTPAELARRFPLAPLLAGTWSLGRQWRRPSEQARGGRSSAGFPALPSGLAP